MIALAQKILIGLAIAIALFSAGFYSGSEHQRSKQFAFALDQRRTDDKSVGRIETADVVSKARTKKVIDEIKKQEPEWADVVIPDAVDQRMRDAGL